MTLKKIQFHDQEVKLSKKLPANFNSRINVVYVNFEIIIIAMIKDLSLN